MSQPEATDREGLHQAGEPGDDGPVDGGKPRKSDGWLLPIALIVLTFLSTLYVGGWRYAVPLMAILLAHEFGHFIAGKRHGIDISPPYFIPMPFFLLGTMGAVIRMRGAIRSRKALLDVGAAGPLAGLMVCLPVLVYGLVTSPVQPSPAVGYIIEGRSLLYLGLLWLVKGPIPEGHDIMLNPTAFAGWAGLLVTMINLLPVGQLDGGHVAYALFGKAQNRLSEMIRRGLPLLAITVSAYYGLSAWRAHESDDTILYDSLMPGTQWLVWAAVLWLMTRMVGPGHPPTTEEPIGRGRRIIARTTLVLFALLFMPALLRFR